MTFTHGMDQVAQAFEVLGALVLVAGLVWSILRGAQTWRSAGGRQGFLALRGTFGGALLLGLEILVAADLIRTIAVAPTLRNVGTLALIVLIRTFLSFSLEVEIDGVLPWRRSSVHNGHQVSSPESGTPSRDASSRR